MLWEKLFTITNNPALSIGQPSLEFFEWIMHLNAFFLLFSPNFYNPISFSIISALLTGSYYKKIIQYSNNNLLSTLTVKCNYIANLKNNSHFGHEQIQYFQKNQQINSINVTLSVKSQLKLIYFVIYCCLNKLVLHKGKNILWKCNLHIFKIDWVRPC